MDNSFVPYLIQEALSRAEQGDGDACYDVAEFYYAQKNYEQAFKWNQKSVACKNPNPNAYFNLGYACQYGEGTPKDMFAAFEYYQKAADLNLPQAMNNLAFFYESGIVVERNLEKADELCRKATLMLNNLQTELFKTQKQCQQMKEQYDELQVTLTSAKSEAATLRDSLEQAQTQVKEYQQTQEILTKQIDQQKQTISELEAVREKAKELKPFIRKNTLLIWLDVISLIVMTAMVIGAMFVTNWCEFIPLILFAAAIIVVYVIAWAMIGYKRYVIYGLLHWVIAVLIVLLAGTAFVAYTSCLFLGVSLMLFWIGCLSFKKEKML